MNSFSRCGVVARSMSAAGLFLLMARLVFVGSSYAQTDTWTGGGSQNCNGGCWSDPANWSNGVPTSTSNVLIDNGNSAHSSVILDVNATINNLTLDSDDSLSMGSFNYPGTTLTLNGNSSTIAGSLTIGSPSTGGTLFIAGLTNSLTVTGGVTIYSTHSHLNGSAGASLINQGGITIYSGDLGGGNLTIVNSGTIWASCDIAGCASINPGAGGLTNTGTIQLQQFAQLNGTVNNSGGTITISNTASSAPGVVLGTVNGGSISLGGTVSFTQINGATITSAAPSACFTGGTLSNVTLNGGFSIPAQSVVSLIGTITNNGGVTVSGNATLNIASSTVTLTGSGVFTVFGAINGPAGNTLINVNNTISGGSIGGGNLTINNQGTIGSATLQPGRVV